MVLFWEETTFTQEITVIRMAGLFAQQAGPSWMVGSGVCPIWSSVASRFTTVTNSGAHNLGIVSCTYFIKQGGEGLGYSSFIEARVLDLNSVLCLCFTKPR